MQTAPSSNTVQTRVFNQYLGNHSPASSHRETASLNGAALILQNGREVPITESMIQDALEKLLR